jgi:hypothetical protein
VGVRFTACVIRIVRGRHSFGWICSYHMSLSGSKVAVDALLETSAKRMLVLSCLLGGGRAKPDAAVPSAATDSGARAQSDAPQLCAARCSRARPRQTSAPVWLHLLVLPTVTPSHAARLVPGIMLHRVRPPSPLRPIACCSAAPRRARVSGRTSSTVWIDRSVVRCGARRLRAQ